MSGIFNTIKKAAGSGYYPEEAGTSDSQKGQDMRFTIEPSPGESGFSQWAAAMKMVAQLQGGIPPEFRRRLWLTLAERHLISQGVDWAKVERNCFSEWSHPADAELGVQIVKDLHRTGCSLFCGEDGQENQALLKRVLLAYARWNKSVGYCQGFNMLAALILQVTDKCESEALKLMIYLIEGVLPESYFADSLRGLSVDMAVFRELLRSKLPRLSRHLDTLQNAAKDGNTSYEPPLTNVFTMQWFLTLFCNCLPQPTVLRVWDLILLEGNEILLRTALAIWQTLADRILSVRTADEFYCLMGVLTGELLESGLIDGNTLIKAVVGIGPLTELRSLREHYMYNINPWGGLQHAVVEKQLKLYPREKLVLDISALKKQYNKLKQRQRQAHIIFSAAISRQPPTTTPVAMNHLLLGKNALVPAKRLGPPKGTIPPARQLHPTTLHWKDTKKIEESDSDSSDTELCDEDSLHSDVDELDKYDDNPKKRDESIISSAETSATILETPIPENLNNASSSSLTIPVLEAVESDEDSLEFEQFLQDRMQCLKQHDSPEQDNNLQDEDKLRYGRRNSERALQIIQENSLILHRILQCQSRFSPSPPTVLEPAISHSSDEFLEDMIEKNRKHCLEDILDGEVDLRNSISEPEIKMTITPTSPEYGNKYSSILEKSKSLDEKYNSLILNQPSSIKLEESDTIVEEKLIQFSPKKAQKTTPCENYEKSISIVDENDAPLENSKIESKNLYSKILSISPEELNEANSKESISFSCDMNSQETLKKSLSTEDLTFYNPNITSDLMKNYDFGYQKSHLDLPKSSTQVMIEKNMDLKEVNTINTIEENKRIKIQSDLTIEEIKKKYSKSKVPEASSFYEKSFSDDQKETFSKFSTLNYKKYCPDLSPNQESIIVDRISKSPDESEFKINYNPKSFNNTTLINDTHSPLNSKSILEEFQSTENCEPELRQNNDSTKTCYNYLDSPVSEHYPQIVPSDINIDEVIREEKKTYTKPINLPVNADQYESTSMKSPTKIFNPFPVPISSRQNKEVPFKLGLYKK